MSAARHLPLLAFLLVGACTALQPAQPTETDAAHRLQRGLSSLDAGLYAEAFEDLAWVYSQCAGHEASHQALAALAAMELDPRNPTGREGTGAELLERLARHPGPPAWTRPLTESAYLMALALGAPSAGAPADTARPRPADAAAAAAPVQADSPAAVPAQPMPVLPDSQTRAPGDTTRRAQPDSLAAHPAPPEPRAEEVEAPPAVAEPTPLSAGEAPYGCGVHVVAEGWVAPQLPALPGASMVAMLAGAEAERARQQTRADSLSEALAATRRELEETRAELERIRKTLKP